MSDSSFAKKQDFQRWGRVASGDLPLIHTHTRTDKCIMMTFICANAGADVLYTQPQVVNESLLGNAADVHSRFEAETFTFNGSESMKQKTVRSTEIIQTPTFVFSSSEVCGSSTLILSTLTNALCM